MPTSIYADLLELVNSRVNKARSCQAIVIGQHLDSKPLEKEEYETIKAYILKGDNNGLSEYLKKIKKQEPTKADLIIRARQLGIGYYSKLTYLQLVQRIQHEEERATKRTTPKTGKDA